MILRFAIMLCAGLAGLCSAKALAEEARCPHADGDTCAEWRLEQAEKELAALVAGPNEWIERMPAQMRDRARAALAEAQSEWIKFRDAECRRELTWAYMTAQTERGFLANCRANAVFHRRNDLDKAYKFTRR